MSHFRMADARIWVLLLAVALLRAVLPARGFKGVVPVSSL